MMRTHRRLEQLEAGGPSDPCDYCGDGGDDDRPYEIVWMDHDDEDLGPDFCPECGRQLVIHVTWGDSPA